MFLCGPPLGGGERVIYYSSYENWYAIVSFRSLNKCLNFISEIQKVLEKFNLVSSLTAMTLAVFAWNLESYLRITQNF